MTLRDRVKLKTGLSRVYELWNHCYFLEVNKKGQVIFSKLVHSKWKSLSLKLTWLKAMKSGQTERQILHWVRAIHLVTQFWIGLVLQSFYLLSQISDLGHSSWASSRVKLVKLVRISNCCAAKQADNRAVLHCMQTNSVMFTNRETMCETMCETNCWYGVSIGNFLLLF